MDSLGSRQVYANAWMTVREDPIRRADGSTGIYGVVDKPDFALVIPLHGAAGTDDDVPRDVRRNSDEPGALERTQLGRLPDHA